jgi:signal transduction histidine kinase
MTYLNIKPHDTKEIKEMVNDIHTSSVRLLAIAEEFLDVANLEQEKVTFKLEEVDLLSQIEECIKELKDKADGKGLYLKLENTATKCIVKCDGTKISQIITNLLGNALKFTNEGGVTVKVRKDSKTAYVEIEDTGIGISEKSQSQLFKKFKQVGDDFYKHDSTQGVGLGLYISKMIMDKMGGRIYLASSKEDRGSVFGFSLPLAKS